MLTTSGCFHCLLVHSVVYCLSTYLFLMRMSAQCFALGMCIYCCCLCFLSQQIFWLLPFYWTLPLFGVVKTPITISHPTVNTSWVRKAVGTLIATACKVKVNNSEQGRDSLKIKGCLWFSVMVPRCPLLDQLHPNYLGITWMIQSPTLPPWRTHCTGHGVGSGNLYVS